MDCIIIRRVRLRLFMADLFQMQNCSAQHFPKERYGLSGEAGKMSQI